MIEIQNSDRYEYAPGKRAIYDRRQDILHPFSRYDLLSSKRTEYDDIFNENRTFVLTTEDDDRGSPVLTLDVREIIMTTHAVYE